METVNVLWTGGLDSTYRIVELSRLPVTIQPYYILDRSRKSAKNELTAMKSITHDVEIHPETKAKLLPVKVIDDSAIKEDSEITEAYKKLHNKYLLGNQYDFLARFADQYGLKLEVGLENSERSHATTTIKAECDIHLHTVPLLGGVNYTAYITAPAKSSREGALVFKNILLPASLWHMSKLDELEGYKALGFGYVIKKTWFCHNPIFGLPCGHCNPCKDCLNEGLAFRVPRIGYVLGSIRRVIKGGWQRVKKLL